MPGTPRRGGEGIDEFLNNILGPSGDVTPSSVPGTPSRPSSSLPGPSVLSPSGRASSNGDVSSYDRISSGTTLANSGTDHVIDRYDLFSVE